MAAAAAGPGLCPHCGRAFKRLRAHLPHCKAAPPPAPAASPRPGPTASPAPGGGRASGARPTPAPGPSPQPGTAPGPSPQPGTAPGPSPQPGTAPGPSPQPGTGSAPGPSPQPGTGSAPGPSPAPSPRPGPGSGPAAPRAVRDVARSLDLHPEEVRDVPGKLRKGVKVVIEGHRARVVRDKEPRSGAGAAGSRGGATEPGPAPRKTAQKPKSKEPRSRGAVASGTGSSAGEKSSLKATKALQEPAESRNSPAERVQQEGRDKSTAGEEQLEAGVGSAPPACALHPGNLHLALSEVCGGHGQGTARKGLGSLRRPGRAPGLALLPTPQIQPPCSSQAAGSSARGLEWFPDLYPDAEGLRIFPGKRFHEGVRITAGTPQDARGQRGPLSERPLLEVRLGELHTWISTCNFSPQGLLGAVQRAWSSYCARYMHVKQGGPAGISMLLAGYCLLSYGWNYQHFKRHRWRKYH